MRLNGLTMELNIDRTEKVAQDWVLLTEDNSGWVDEEQPWGEGDASETNSRRWCPKCQVKKLFQAGNSDLLFQMLLRGLVKWDLKTDHGTWQDGDHKVTKIKILAPFTRAIWQSQNTGRLGSEKGKIRTIEDSFKNLCFKRIQRDDLRTKQGQAVTGIFFFPFCFLLHVYVPIKIIQ